jgi:hypothetical protein
MQKTQLAFPTPKGHAIYQKKKIIPTQPQGNGNKLQHNKNSLHH